MPARRTGPARGSTSAWGAVRIDVADAHAELEVGDTAAYDGDVVHGYRCASPSPAVFVLTVIESNPPSPAGAHAR